MKKIITFVALASALHIGATLAADTSALTVNKGSNKAGDGNSVTFQGNPLPLVGTGIEIGKPLPSAVLTNGSLGPVNLADTKGKVKILNIVPSVDTKTCEAQTHELSEKNGGLDKLVELYTVSMDLPFAQSRFAKEAKISNVTFLSDYKTGEFGKSNGLMVGQIGRAHV